MEQPPTARSVPIPIYIKDNLQHEGIWTLGIWQYSPTTVVWGLLCEDSPTQMNYGLDYALPHKAIRERREKYSEKQNEDWLRWYFDAGRGLYATLDDLEIALWALDHKAEDETS
jgi:hypothetical protein